MPNYTRVKIPGATYFFTVVAHDRHRLLTSPEVLAALRRAIESTRTTHPFQIDAWVLLPDHLHAIWTLPPDDVEFGKRWGMVKARVSRECAHLLDSQSQSHRSASLSARRESGFWQRRFWEHCIRGEADLERHLNYIHFNPVKHGLVRRVVDWPHSTFHRYVKKGVYAPDWCGMPDEEYAGGFGEALD